MTRTSAGQRCCTIQSARVRRWIVQNAQSKANVVSRLRPGAPPTTCMAYLLICVVEQNWVEIDAIVWAIRSHRLRMTHDRANFVKTRHPQNRKYIKCRNAAKEDQPQSSCTENLVKFCWVVFEICVQTERQKNILI